jgi:hypothetical protein
MAGTGSLKVVYSRGTSFGLDVPEEVKSSMRFCFFFAPWASDSARRQSGVASLRRTLGFIPVLVLTSLGGFGVSSGNFSIDGSFLGNRRAWSQKLVVLQIMQSIEHQQHIVKGKTREWNISLDCKSRTCGKGCVESKKVARHAWTSIFAVRVVNDLTLLLRSFFFGSWDDTREG